MEEVYKVTTYQSAYEPYVITSKRVSWCDERFTGYGGNKAACLFEMYLTGVSFYVMADHFLIHQSHKYEEEARREEVSRLPATRSALAEEARCRESIIASCIPTSRRRCACGTLIIVATSGRSHVLASQDTCTSFI